MSWGGVLLVKIVPDLASIAVWVDLPIVWVLCSLVVFRELVR